MEIPEKDTTPYQLALVGRAAALTKAQFATAREIARDELQFSDGAVSDDVLLQIVKILALNVQSQALRPK